MKTLIIYASRYGTTEKCALQLGKLLAAEPTIINLTRQRVPKLQDFDTIILGGSIRAGKIQKAVQRFCAKYQPMLLTKRLGLFLCCMEQSEKGWQQFDNAYPPELRAQALAKGLFGGEFLFDRMNWLERLIIKKISGATQSVSAINDAAITSFAQTITQ